MRVLLLQCLLALTSVALVSGAHVTTSLTISQYIKYNDCTPREVLLTNGTYIGPTITTTKGDTISITVYNNAVIYPITIHWHGIRNLGTPFYDGPSRVTQCPIPPGGNMTYTFQTEAAGTYWYHIHHASLRTIGGYGAFIVKETPGAEPFSYDEEKIVFVQDWFHESIGYQVAGLEGHFPPVGVPGGEFLYPQYTVTGTLINGVGNYYNPTTNTYACGSSVTSTSFPYSTLEFQSNKVYRLRVINSGASNIQRISIPGHTLKLVEVEGDYVNPLTVSSWDVNTGERYSFLINTTGVAAGNYWGTVTSSPVNAVGTPAEFFLVHYTSAAAISSVSWPPNSTLLSATQVAPAYGIGDLTSSAAFIAQHPVPAYATKTITFSYQLAPQYFPRVRMSDFDFANTPLLQARYANATSQLPIGSQGHTVATGEVVDFVFQNFNLIPGIGCEAHPWHLHGHSFWVVGSGSGAWNATTSPSTYNLVNPVFRDTHTSAPMGTSNLNDPCGWTVYRMKLDNPGVWFLHCHTEWHMELGMGTVLNVGDISELPPLPTDFPQCGAYPYSPVTTTTTLNTGNNIVNINFANMFNGVGTGTCSGSN